MSDTDTARALEVLGKITPGDWRFVSTEETGDCNEVQCVHNGVAIIVCDDEFGGTGPKDLRAIAAVPALVALYAADVEEAIAYGNAMLATANADLSTEEWQAANEHWNKARAARRECLANVAKAVLP